MALQNRNSSICACYKINHNCTKSTNSINSTNYRFRGVSGNLVSRASDRTKYIGLRLESLKGLRFFLVSRHCFSQPCIQTLSCFNTVLVLLTQLAQVVFNCHVAGVACVLTGWQGVASVCVMRLITAQLVNNVWIALSPVQVRNDSLPFLLYLWLRNDQKINNPCNFNTFSSENGMRRKRNVKYGITLDLAPNS